MFDWVTVPTGTVHRGTSIGDVPAVLAAHAEVGIERGWILKESPAAVLHVPAFAIARTPVTNAQWAAFRRATGGPEAASIGPDDADADADHTDADHPVDGVAWAEAEAFCRWAAAETGLPIRLPTETEWERAARGDDTREYPWGDGFEPGRANIAGAATGTTPVTAFPAGASPFGVLDLAGNVDEWTSTLYAPYPGAPAEVPPVEAWATDPHITRGGSYHQDRDLARCARRHGVYPPLSGAGFRVVRTLDTTD